MSMDHQDSDLKPRAARPWWRGKIAVAGLVGLLVGATAAAGVTTAVLDPTRSEEYRALEEQLDRAAMERENAQDATRSVEERLSSAQTQIRSYEDAEDALAEREAAVSSKESEVAAREAAVTATEQRIAATTITEGTWTVGRDVEPGTYTTAAAITSGRCYWAIYTSGTNGSDIVENDIVTGGIPTVTLSAGQDFNTSRCGEWVKQG